MSYICGIDEAGRGSILGPLVIAGVCVPEDTIPLFQELGVKDSKLLSPIKREEIFNLFVARKVRFFYSHISPAQIDRASLNWLEQSESVKIIKILNPHEVFLDVPARGKGIIYYCQGITDRIHPDIRLTGGNKFDIIHPVVSAASIVAKVMRDRAIALLKESYGDFGSGYPTKRTVLYIQKHYATIRPIVRTKWRSIKELGIVS